MILSDSDKLFIKQNILNADEIINSNDVDLLLNKISEVMMFEGFDDNDEINDFGRAAERVYDNIFYNN
ncbi:hypothetical protein UMC2_08191 [[Clostridium] sordellii]|uniref:hypothetical protein n=1 Tax=Paraclostridium sordellii TaxID=1505 RepID=UPI00054327D2|nr:hypothetical protein [Paeniclostridium sordellii]CEK33569.1 hypothetical protein UMC2_08191 [[Clostridium] sordellii] [Paeniclostridium sordellii]